MSLINLGLHYRILIDEFRSYPILERPQRILFNLDNVNINSRYKKGKKKVQDIYKNIVSIKDSTSK